MIDRVEIDRLMANEAAPAVTLLLPTHTSGREIRQDPIRLRNLLNGAAARLMDDGWRDREVEELLAPARALVDDAGFWREQERGLAVFVAPGFFRALTLPYEPPEEAVVARRFHLRHLLPAIAGGQRFLVLTVSADRCRLFEATRKDMTELREIELPNGVDEVADESLYETHQQSSPGIRPRAKTAVGVAAAHNFESPEELRKAQFVEYLRRVAAAVEGLAKQRELPVVLAAQPEVQGHLRALNVISTLIDQGVSENPDALDEADLHRLACAAVEPLREADRARRYDELNMRLGDGNGQASTILDDIVRAARYGRIDTLFLSEDGHMWGRIDEAPDGAISVTGGDDDLLDYAAVQTLRHGGRVEVVPGSDLPGDAAAAAIFRY